MLQAKKTAETSNSLESTVLTNKIEKYLEDPVVGLCLRKIEMTYLMMIGELIKLTTLVLANHYISTLVSTNAPNYCN